MNLLKIFCLAKIIRFIENLKFIYIILSMNLVKNKYTLTTNYYGWDAKWKKDAKWGKKYK